MSASSFSFEPTTYVVELTPVGRGAVAVVLIDGAAAVRSVDACFTARSGRTIANTPIGRIAVGNWGGPAGEELVVCRRDQQRVEVQCHGGLAASRAIINSLTAEECEEVSWRTWCLRSADDRIRAEARIALADATTMRSAAILLDQLNGAITAAIHLTIAAVAAEQWSTAAEIVSEMLKHGELGLHLTTPWRVVLAGPPNVGKSSLINSLAGFERAIVSPTPGTTRDVVTLATAIEGWPVQLADTAGLRPSDDELESAGVVLAQTMLAAADLVIIVNDVTRPTLTIDGAFRSLIRSDRVIEVWNKVDLKSERAEIVSGDDEPRQPETILETSAATRQGVSELLNAIAAALVPDPPRAAAAVPFLPRHIEGLNIARNAIERRNSAIALDALHSLLASEAPR
ncbi:MAG TPA: GTP-binding protein [Lacipirellulaceae bacterium]|nr:GTP-binding protein [Lacipirellulaceae bacterium]